MIGLDWASRISSEWFVAFGSAWAMQVSTLPRGGSAEGVPVSQNCSLGTCLLTHTRSLGMSMIAREARGLLIRERQDPGQPDAGRGFSDKGWLGDDPRCPRTARQKFGRSGDDRIKRKPKAAPNGTFRRLFDDLAPASFAVSKRYRRQATVEYGAILHSMQLGAVKDGFIDDADKLMNRWDQSGRARTRYWTVDAVTVLSDFCNGSFTRHLLHDTGVSINVKRHGYLAYRAFIVQNFCGSRCGKST